MPDFEKLGVFYLGKEFDLDARRPKENLLLYDAKDLTTHAFCVGMTGSGKTGLCLTLLEEAAIDGIPAIAIDPKGDLGNLLLTFPELRPADFEPWVDRAEATRKGLSPAQLAEQTAAQWREGLAAWGQAPERIARFRGSCDVAIYTPGSTAGLPLSVLRSFSPPPAETLNDSDALRERLSADVSGLLALLKIDADPLRSREHILLATILEHAWRDGRSLDLAGLIREIQAPPFEKIGVMDLETIYPAKERAELSMALNNLLASPGFSTWMEGDSLDVQRLLYTAQGKPRLSILSIAHLSDAERMFFVTLLLNAIISWMRRQPGTSSLRALLYMDEVFGFFPPSANPPSKTPMLTLLKQARAYGLGIMLATQNPVDLDYKGLSNTGTWFIGRLQTERDKARVLDGLEGASAAAGAAFDRQQLDRMISGLGNRVFLMNNVHDDQPVPFQTRQALSYLHGPLTREQIQSLMGPRKEQAGGAKPQATGDAGGGGGDEQSRAGGQRPVLPPEIPEFFLPRHANVSAGAKLLYRPTIAGTARVHYVQASSGVDCWQSLSLSAPVDAKELSDSLWDDVAPSFDAEPEFEKSPDSQAASFAPIPADLTRPRRFAALEGQLKDSLFRTQSLTIWKCTALKQFSRPGESEGDFRIRLSQAAREKRDQQIEKLKARYHSKFATVEEKIRKAQQKLEKEKSQASQQTWQTAMTAFTSVLAAIFSRKWASATNMSRAAAAARAAGRAGREKEDVVHAEETLESLIEQRASLDTELKAEEDAANVEAHPESLQLDELTLKPRKSDITVSRVALVWTPCLVREDGSVEKAC